MTTYAAYHYSDLKRFIEEYIRPRMENGNVVLIALDKVGTWRAPSQKKKYYTTAFAVSPDVFVLPDKAILSLMSSFAFAIFVIPAKWVNQDPITSQIVSMEEFVK